ncbi:class I SAM-dependent methyltransferase [Massilia sp. G4R7]|uniref:Class I SAM-dependent methyltransferase n=1 Tax=Massilia phyllostachyos TaxID=2898585 RepID=A0ABS8QA19_9BURK|nr:class I SAM-dependent methyltransferase [Massilia phyllostachyos]MCD2518588.1 class I SAM-dependent methyltransferase [Massilia phyllostachyos]
MKPAVAALLLQVAAFPLTLGVTWLLARSGVSMSYLGVALIQGAIAAGLTWWRGLASWWRVIQLLFPLALFATAQLNIPPLAFLAIFLFLLFLYWSTYRTQVPYYPSNRPVWDAVAALLPPEGKVRVIDIGSGLGGFTLDMAGRRPGIEATGIELAPLPWLASSLRARLGKSTARFIRGDYDKLDFADYDLVFAYLSPAAMGALWRKASCEMRPGSLLVSYEFVIADRLANRTVYPTKGGPGLYIWHF